VKSAARAKLLLIGNDPALAYLVSRFAERSGHDIALMQSLPPAQEVCGLRPAAILFPSLEMLEAAQSLISELADCDIPVMVCSSTIDEARARELGADHCLWHPLTYDGFLAALPAVGASNSIDS
jgi:CheY-like chemotaxis protein